MPRNSTARTSEDDLVLGVVVAADDVVVLVAVIRVLLVVEVRAADIARQEVGEDCEEAASVDGKLRAACRLRAKGHIRLQDTCRLVLRHPRRVDVVGEGRAIDVLGLGPGRSEANGTADERRGEKNAKHHLRAWTECETPAPQAAGTQCG